MRIFLVPFAAAALFACANYGASAMSLSRTDGIKAGDQAVLTSQLTHHHGQNEKADTLR